MTEKQIFSNNPETSLSRQERAKQKRKKHLVKAVKTVLTGTVILGGAVGCADLLLNAAESQAQHAKEVGSEYSQKADDLAQQTDWPTALPNFDIESITLTDGARLRQEPHVEDPNTNEGLLYTLAADDNESDTVTVSTPGGVYEHWDNDKGLFYGVPVENLESVIPSNIPTMAQDEDDIVWISDIMADPIKRK